MKYRVVIIDEDGEVFEQGVYDSKESALEHKQELIKDFDYVAVYEVKP